MSRYTRFFASLWLVLRVAAYHYDPQYTEWNLNQNPYATSPNVSGSRTWLECADIVKEYWGAWLGHDFTPSPDNWRFPFYTIMPDRFVNGDVFNDNVNETFFEHDISSNQMRHGGDVVGIQNSLDYLQGMGIKVRAIRILVVSQVTRPEPSEHIARHLLIRAHACNTP